MDKFVDGVTGRPEVGPLPHLRASVMGMPPMVDDGWPAGRPTMIVGVDHAGSRAARRGGLALPHRLVGALEIIVDHAALVDLETDRIIWIVSLGPRRRRGIGRAERHNRQSRNAHHDLPGTNRETRCLISRFRRRWNTPACGSLEIKYS